MTTLTSRMRTVADGCSSASAETNGAVSSVLAGAANVLWEAVERLEYLQKDFDNQITWLKEEIEEVEKENERLEKEKEDLQKNLCV